MQRSQLFYQLPPLDLLECLFPESDSPLSNLPLRLDRRGEQPRRGTAQRHLLGHPNLQFKLGCHGEQCSSSKLDGGSKDDSDLCHNLGASVGALLSPSDLGRDLVTRRATEGLADSGHH